MRYNVAPKLCMMTFGNNWSILSRRCNYTFYIFSEVTTYYLHIRNYIFWDFLKKLAIISCHFDSLCQNVGNEPEPDKIY